MNADQKYGSVLLIRANLRKSAAMLGLVSPNGEPETGNGKRKAEVRY
jgi:hypothetical protein